MDWREKRKRYGDSLKITWHRKRYIDIRKKMVLKYSGGPSEPIYHYKIGMGIYILENSI